MWDLEVNITPRNEVHFLHSGFTDRRRRESRTIARDKVRHLESKSELKCYEKRQCFKVWSQLTELRLDSPTGIKLICSSKHSSSPRHASFSPPSLPRSLPRSPNHLYLHPSLRASDTPVRPVWDGGPPRDVYLEHSAARLAPGNAGVKKRKSCLNGMTRCGLIPHSLKVASNK